MAESRFLKATTILPVHDIDVAAAWYGHALGFETVYIHGSGRRGEAENFANYAVLRSGDVEFHLILDEGGPAWTRAGVGHLSIAVSDVDAVHAAVLARSVSLARPLQRENWPARGFNLIDPSGNEVHVEQADG